MHISYLRGRWVADHHCSSQLYYSDSRVLCKQHAFCTLTTRGQLLSAVAIIRNLQLMHSLIAFASSVFTTSNHRTPCNHWKRYKAFYEWWIYWTTVVSMQRLITNTESELDPENGVYCCSGISHEPFYHPGTGRTSGIKDRNKHLKIQKGVIA